MKRDGGGWGIVNIFLELKYFRGVEKFPGGGGWWLRNVREVEIFRGGGL